MNLLTIEVASIEESNARFMRAMSGEPVGHFLSFPSEDLLFTVLNARRWPLLRALTGAGPVGVRELARRVGRDVKSVHGDTQALAKAGVIDKLPNGKLHFPYDEVRLKIGWRAAA